MRCEPWQRPRRWKRVQTRVAVLSLPAALESAEEKTRRLVTHAPGKKRACAFGRTRIFDGARPASGDAIADSGEARRGVEKPSLRAWTRPGMRGPGGGWAGASADISLVAACSSDLKSRSCGGAGGSGAEGHTFASDDMQGGSALAQTCPPGTQPAHRLSHTCMSLGVLACPSPTDMRARQDPNSSARQ